MATGSSASGFSGAAAAVSGSRMSERLVILKKEGQNLLVKLYNLKKWLAWPSDHPKSLPGFFANIKTLAKFAADMQGLKDVAQIDKYKKSCEDALKVKQQAPIVAVFDQALEVFAAAKDYLGWVVETMREIAAEGYVIKANYAPSMTVNLLETLHVYSALGLLLQRIPFRKVIIAIELRLVGKNHPSANPFYEPETIHQLAEFLFVMDDPVPFLFMQMRPYTKVIELAFLSISMLYAKQCSSASQWETDNFIKIIATSVLKVSDDTESATLTNGLTSLQSIFNYPCGLEDISFSRLERFVFWGFFYCPEIVEIPSKDKRESGEFKIWSLIYHTMWVIPLVRDEVIWIHDFTCKSYNKLSSIKAAVKKVSTVKKMYHLALRSAPKYHRERRLFILQELRNYFFLCKDKPGLLGPRFPQLKKLISLSTDEINWLFCHQSNLPNKKEDLKYVNNGDSSMSAEMTLWCDDLPRLLHVTISTWSFAEENHSITVKYFKDYIFGMSIPELHQNLTSQISESSGEMEVPGLICSLDDGITIAQKMFLNTGDREYNVADEVRVLKSILMDAIRYETVMTHQKVSADSKDQLKETSLLVDRVELQAKIALSGTSDTAPSVLSEVNTLFNCLLSYPKVSVRYFKTTLNSTQNCQYSIAFHTSCSLYPVMCSEACPDDWIEIEKFASISADHYGVMIVERFFQAFSVWYDCHVILNENQVNYSESAIKLTQKVSHDKEKKELAKDQENGNAMLKLNQDLNHSYEIVAKLCDAIENSFLVLDGNSLLDVFLNEIQKHFQSILPEMLTFYKDESRPPPYPSVVELKLSTYFECICNLSKFVTFDVSYVTMSLVEILKHSDLAVLYLENYVKFIKHFLADKNLLCFSETMQSFVLAPFVEEWRHVDPDSYSRAKQLEIWVSTSELDSLVEVFGYLGADFVIQTLMNTGISDCVMIWHTLALKLSGFSSKKSGSSTSINIVDFDARVSQESLQAHHEILKQAVKIGVYINLRNLINDSLERLTKSRVSSVFVHLLPNQNVMDEVANPQEIFDMIGFSPLTTNCERALANFLLRFDWMTSDMLSVLMTSLVNAIPFASRLPSSLYVGETLRALDHKPTNSYHYNTIDGHFNNLNCITSTVAHIFTAGITGTLDTRDPTVYSSMFEQFLSDLVFNMRQYGICKNMAVNKREEPMMKINYESVLLLISIICEKVPQLNIAILNKYFPMPAWILHRANRKITSRKELRLLTVDIKTITPSKYGKAAWTATLKDTL